jgi:hypothetical protein
MNCSQIPSRWGSGSGPLLESVKCIRGNVASVAGCAFSRRGVMKKKKTGRIHFIGNKFSAIKISKMKGE